MEADGEGSGIGDEAKEGAVESDSNVRDGACVGVGGDSEDAETKGEGARVVSEVDEKAVSDELAACACASELVGALDAEAC